MKFQNMHSIVFTSKSFMLSSGKDENCRIFFHIFLVFWNFFFRVFNSLAIPILLAPVLSKNSRAHNERIAFHVVHVQLEFHLGIVCPAIFIQSNINHNQYSNRHLMMGQYSSTKRSAPSLIGEFGVQLTYIGKESKISMLEERNPRFS